MEKHKALPKFTCKKIKVTPLASESFGVRSMCTLVETSDVSVLLDAGVSLCPYRFSLPPHPIEFQTIAKLRLKIAEAADRAEVVMISHYHFHHHTHSSGRDWVVNWTEANETARQTDQKQNRAHEESEGKNQRQPKTARMAFPKNRRQIRQNIGGSRRKNIHLRTDHAAFF